MARGRGGGRSGALDSPCRVFFVLFQYVHTYSTGVVSIAVPNDHDFVSPSREKRVRRVALCQDLFVLFSLALQVRWREPAWRSRRSAPICPHLA